MVRTKKAQAAMEFLMTYGWTILVALVVIGALIYFDVFNPGKFLPKTCNVPGFSCEDFVVTTSIATVFLTNNQGDDINVTVASFGDWSTTGINKRVQIGKSIKIDIDITAGAIQDGERLKLPLNITYITMTSGISHTSKGEIATIVE